MKETIKRINKINRLKEYLLENYVDEFGNLDIRGLDFSDFEGNVLISFMKVKGDLVGSHCEVGGNLHQGFQVVKGEITWKI